MERTLAHRRDEAIKRDIVDLIGFDPLPARMTRQTRKPDAGSALRKLGQQSSPTRAQGGLPRWPQLLEATGTDGCKEVGPDVAESLGREPGGERIDCSKLSAKHREVERNVTGRGAEQLRHPVHGRAEIAQSGRREVSSDLERIEHRLERCGGSGWAASGFGIAFEGRWVV
jgi:hypothetical protein